MSLLFARFIMSSDCMDILIAIDRDLQYYLILSCWMSHPDWDKAAAALFVKSHPQSKDKIRRMLASGQNLINDPYGSFIKF